MTRKKCAPALTGAGFAISRRITKGSLRGGKKKVIIGANLTFGTLASSAPRKKEKEKGGKRRRPALSGKETLENRYSSLSFSVCFFLSALFHPRYSPSLSIFAASYPHPPGGSLTCTHSHTNALARSFTLAPRVLYPGSLIAGYAGQ